MRINKAISLSFLLFANMVIMAHAAVFHHHHSRITAVSGVENQEHRCTRHHDSEHCCTIENCFLSSPFTKTDGIEPVKQVAGSRGFTVNNSQAYRITPVTDLAGLPSRQKPYLSLPYPKPLSLYAGLRERPPPADFSVSLLVNAFLWYILFAFTNYQLIFNKNENKNLSNNYNSCCCRYCRQLRE